MNARLGHGRLAALAVGLAVAGAAFGGDAALAQTANYPPGGIKLPSAFELQDWDGVWERSGDLVWDDRVPVGAPQAPPYNDDYQKLFAQAPAQQRVARPGQPGAAGGGGRAGGMPGMMIMQQPMEVQVNPHEVLIISAQGATRRIYTDGRLHAEDPIASGMGHSIGHWKNSELFVDTCCFSENTRLPGGGPHSDAMHITEHFYSPKPGVLVDEMSVEDPKAFIKPWTTVKTFHRRPDLEVLPTDAPRAAGPPAAAPAAAAMSVDKTLIGDLWANPAAKAVLLKDLPAIEPYVDMVGNMTLTQVAPQSQGVLDDAKLDEIQADFDKAGK